MLELSTPAHKTASSIQTTVPVPDPSVQDNTETGLDTNSNVSVPDHRVQDNTKTALDTSVTDSGDVDDDPEVIRFMWSSLSQPSIIVVNWYFNFECMKPETVVPGGLKSCTHCFMAKYCSRDCQTKHWRLHQSVCKSGGCAE